MDQNWFQVAVSNDFWLKIAEKIHPSEFGWCLSGQHEMMVQLAWIWGCLWVEPFLNPFWSCTSPPQEARQKCCSQNPWTLFLEVRRKCKYATVWFWIMAFSQKSTPKGSFWPGVKFGPQTSWYRKPTKARNEVSPAKKRFLSSNFAAFFSKVFSSLTPSAEGRMQSSKLKPSSAPFTMSDQEKFPRRLSFSKKWITSGMLLPKIFFTRGYDTNSWQIAKDSGCHGSHYWERQSLWEFALLGSSAIQG